MSTIVPGVTTTFGRARRRNAYRRLARIVGAQAGAGDLLPLDEAERRLRPFRRRYVGLRAIPLEQVVGTDSRSADFDRDFLPRRPEIGERWRRVEQAFPEGDFPPIAVYQLGDAYFVVDGHHRVAIARQRGMEAIDAEVTELQARWHLPADADVVELIHAEQERFFMVESGLDRARPDARIRFGRPAGYIELLENVQIHGYHLMLAAGRALPREEIAADWYDNVYTPALETIRDERLAESCETATEADLFLIVYRRRRELVPDRGCTGLDAAARRVTEDWRKGRRLTRRLLGSRSA